jgi:hypothetical protein
MPLIAMSFLLVCAGRPSFADKPSSAHAPSGDVNNQTEKLTEGWSRIIPVAEPPEGKFGEWRFTVKDGWLLAERRTGEGEIEWKIVLAEAVGDEPPEIVVNRPPQGGGMRKRRRDANGVLAETIVPGPTGPIPGSLRLSYRDGRYFIRDGFSSLRCLRQAKSGDDAWPHLEVPPRDENGFGSGMSASRTAVLSGQVSNSWITVVAGPQGAPGNAFAADAIVRLAHMDLREAGAPLKFTGGDMASVTVGDWFALDDGDLLVANKLDTWRLPNALMARARRDPILAVRLAMEKLGGSPAPELSDEEWLNAEKPPAWDALRGKPVLLVLFDLKQRLFLPLVAPLLDFEKTYGKQGLTIIGIHAHAPRDELRKQLADERINFPVLIDDGNTEGRFGIGFSACFLVGRDGKVVSVYKDSLAPPADIEKLLGESIGK